MTRTFKIYDIDKTAIAAIPGARVVQGYPAFVIAEVDEVAAQTLAVRSGLIEDISDQYTIPHAGGNIDTSRPRVDAAGVTRAHADYRGAPALPAGPHHYLVQFVGPIKAAWPAAVKKAGGEVMAPWDGFAVVVRMTAKAASEVARLPSVRWVGHLPYAARLAPAVKGRESGETRDPLTPRTRIRARSYVVQFFRANLATKALAKVKRLGFEVLDQPANSELMIVRGKTGVSDKQPRLSERLASLSQVHGVRSISAQAMRRTSNDQAARIMGTARSVGFPGAAAASLGLSGAGEMIGVCDTGLDNGDPATIHPDFKGRVLAIKSYPVSPDFDSDIKNPRADDGPADVDSGHGTHVSGSVLGDGRASAQLPGLVGPVRGLAYKAKLVFQAVEQQMQWKNPKFDIDPGRFLLSGLPADLGPLFAWAYGKGARIHSNSWGGGDAGAYDQQCLQLDNFVWNHPDFCILVAAGNDGTDHNADGVVDLGSVTSPGTAKNCITVGASENNRPQFTLTYGQWPDYPAPPIHSDRLADNPDQIAAFSSRGAAAGGRIKPDLVAPGTFILSTRSRLLAANQFGYGRFAPSKLYMYDSGTSMATPLTAGAVGVLREYLRKNVKISAPSAALLKAALIAGAVGVDPAASRPNNNEGFGRVNLDSILAPPAPLKARFIEGAGLATGAQSDTVLQVAIAGAPLKVVLAYSDYPGPQLVNNLNLIVTDPDGVNHVGNSAAGAANFDKANNVEIVSVPAGAAGQWRMRVVASNVTKGPQPFALVGLGAWA